jgi:methylated-DNA-[protein]-cysteine S-methyltransferase
MLKMWYYDFPVGTLGIAQDDTGITHIFLKGDSTPPDFAETETPLLQKAAQQLAEYFDGKRARFDLPLSLHGTPFQLDVWAALQEIPCGETRSYKQIAEAVGRPKACRAVGMANHRNPVMIVVPCHRVIGHNGSMVGYAGGLDVKEQLLALEKKN